MSADRPTTVRDAVCTRCGCVCDDLTVTVCDNRVVGVAPPCPLAESWLMAFDDAPAVPAWIEGQPAPLDAALGAAAALLRRARAPLIYGLSRSSIEGVRAAVRLADGLGATIDVAGSRAAAAAIIALQRVGQSTCSLGEVRNRCDLILVWGADPLRSHPRLLERFAGPRIDSPTLSALERFVVVIDTERTATAQRADLFLQVAPGTDFEILWTLRALLEGLAIDDNAMPGGVDTRQLAAFVRRMRTCRAGVVLFGAGLTRSPGGGHHAVEALLRLVAELNRHTRFYALRLPQAGNAVGADSVLCWQTGFPLGVNLARGYPRYEPVEYSASALLERGEADACVLVDSQALTSLSALAQQRVRHMPSVVLDTLDTACPFTSSVAFTTAVPGVHTAGSVHRMDGIPLPLRPFLHSRLPTDADVLSAILRVVALPC